jgi:hypothetical protein
MLPAKLRKRSPACSLPPDQFDDQYNDGYQEKENGQPVHAVHQFDVGVHGVVRVSFFDVEILQYLAPDAFHTRKYPQFGALSAQESVFLRRYEEFIERLAARPVGYSRVCTNQYGTDE